MIEKDLERRRRAAPFEGNAQLLLQLALRCEREEPSVALDASIGAAIGNHNGARWWTRNLEDASTLSGWALIHASDIGADGLPYVMLSDGTHEAKGVAGRNLTLTWCAAALRAYAYEAVAVAQRSEDAPNHPVQEDT